jgi:hypothetical protein
VVVDVVVAEVGAAAEMAEVGVKNTLTSQT